MTATTTPQLALTRNFNAPRALVYQAFTDPDHFAAWRSPSWTPRSPPGTVTRTPEEQQWPS